MKYVPEAHGRLASDYRSRFKAHLLALEVALQRIKEEAVMRDGEPDDKSQRLASTAQPEGR